MSEKKKKIIQILWIVFLCVYLIPFNNENVKTFDSQTLSALNNTSEAKILKQGILNKHLSLQEFSTIFIKGNGLIVGHPTTGIVGVVNNNVFNQAVEEGVIRFTSEPKDVKLKNDIFHLTKKDVAVIEKELLSDGQGHNCYISPVDDYTLRRVNITFMFTTKESKKYKSWDI